MLEWIAKYWLEVLFSAIVSGIGFMIRQYIKHTKDAQQEHENKLLSSIEKKLDEQKKDVKTELQGFNDRLELQKTEMQTQMTSCYANMVEVVNKRDNNLLEADKVIRADIQGLKEEFGSVKSGMLTVQGRAFKDECHRLLEPDHIISLTEYENILTEHATYNALGGNHEGDALFAMVETKYKHNLTQAERYYIGGQLNA